MQISAVGVVSWTLGGPVRVRVRFSTPSSPRLSATASNLTHGPGLVSVMMTCVVMRLKSACCVYLNYC